MACRVASRVLISLNADPVLSWHESHKSALAGREIEQCRRVVAWQPAALTMCDVDPSEMALGPFRKSAPRRGVIFHGKMPTVRPPNVIVRVADPGRRPLNHELQKP